MPEKKDEETRRLNWRPGEAPAVGKAVAAVKSAFSRPSAKSVARAGVEVASVLPVGGAGKGLALTAKAAKTSNPARGLAVKTYSDLLQPSVMGKIGEFHGKQGEVSLEKTKERARKIVERVRALKNKVT